MVAVMVPEREVIMHDFQMLDGTCDKMHSRRLSHVIGCSSFSKRKKPDKSGNAHMGEVGRRMPLLTRRVNTFILDPSRQQS
jgi:hypothetical protein